MIEAPGMGYAAVDGLKLYYQVCGSGDPLALEAVDLTGYSLGGGVALQMAIRHPRRVKRLGVVSFPFAGRSVRAFLSETRGAGAPEAAAL